MCRPFMRMRGMSMSTEPSMVRMRVFLKFKRCKSKKPSLLEELCSLSENSDSHSSSMPSSGSSLSKKSLETMNSAELVETSVRVT